MSYHVETRLIAPISCIIHSLTTPSNRWCLQQKIQPPEGYKVWPPTGCQFKLTHQVAASCGYCLAISSSWPLMNNASDRCQWLLLHPSMTVWWIYWCILYIIFYTSLLYMCPLNLWNLQQHTWCLLKGIYSKWIYSIVAWHSYAWNRARLYGPNEV